MKNWIKYFSTAYRKNWKEIYGPVQASLCRLDGEPGNEGVHCGFSETCDYDAEKIKSILRKDTSSVMIEARLVALAAWMKEYYGGTMIQALKTVLPIRKRADPAQTQGEASFKMKRKERSS